MLQYLRGFADDGSVYAKRRVSARGILSRRLCPVNSACRQPVRPPGESTPTAFLAANARRNHARKAATLHALAELREHFLSHLPAPPCVAGRIVATLPVRLVAVPLMHGGGRSIAEYDSCSVKERMLTSGMSQSVVQSRTLSCLTSIHRSSCPPNVRLRHVVARVDPVAYDGAPFAPTCPNKNAPRMHTDRRISTRAVAICCGSGASATRRLSHRTPNSHGVVSLQWIPPGTRIGPQGHSHGRSPELSAVCIARLRRGWRLAPCRLCRLPFWSGQQFETPTVGDTNVRSVVCNRDEWCLPQQVHAYLYAMRLLGILGCDTGFCLYAGTHRSIVRSTVPRGHDAGDARLASKSVLLSLRIMRR